MCCTHQIPLIDNYLDGEKFFCRWVDAKADLKITLEQQTRLRLSDYCDINLYAANIDLFWHQT